ncbi:SH3 domain-containing kinase-binding protein 1 isoform X5 [Salmo salar]|uniref:Osteoclast-stimulating factor 1 n=1 Tax=Salmo salar TaxID=8030 RepID=A0A1S3QAN0_SALSA|nr:SH3 domain-containing kinase-binding protein 1 isoform X5 [Salmo salar]|eukprot:XP_014037001.1 PREDICTED: SH3 domain-containing kinase-binding protein 1 isoform X2 [Salmo salar]
MVEAVVEFDYEAQQEDELSLRVGDIIVKVTKDDGGWWKGEIDGRRGLFPDNFVREMKKEVKRAAGPKSDLSNGSTSPVPEPDRRPARKGDQIHQRRCKATFSYVPQNEDELELKIGDVIHILGEVEEGWWEGSLNGKTGMFPSNFTRELEDTPPSLDTSTRSSQEELRSNKTSKDSPGSESDGGESRSDSGEIQPKKVRGFGFGDIFKAQPIRLRPASGDMDTEGEKAQVRKSPSVSLETMKAEPEGMVKGRELCKVIFPYDANNEDELSMKEGEIVTIINRDCADAGWWMGEIGGRKGVFPDNFVKLLIPDVEKERPKKPPPPSVPSGKHTTDVVYLDSLVLSTEKLSHPTAMRPRVLVRRPRSLIISTSSLSSIDQLDSPVVEEQRKGKDREKEEQRRGKDREKEEQRRGKDREKELQERKALPTITVPDSKGVLPPKPAVLHPPSTESLALRPISPSPSYTKPTSSCISPSPEPRPTPTLEELRGQLRELRASVELLKSQHRQEMKHLSSDLDEEKRIRLTMQMEVEKIKRSLFK